MENIVNATTNHIENYALNQSKITKSLAEIAKENNSSYLGVINVYNKFNYRLYSGEVYNPELDENALKLTQKYFGIQKIRASKN